MSARDPGSRRRFSGAYGLSLLAHVLFFIVLFQLLAFRTESGPGEVREQNVASTTITLETVRPMPTPVVTITPKPTTLPSVTPTYVPTPKVRPKQTPLRLPRPVATLAVSFKPTFLPTAIPSVAPTRPPTVEPTPTIVPTVRPTPVPTLEETVRPTPVPTLRPTPAPTETPEPATAPPTLAPTRPPTSAPTTAPTSAPTQAATAVARATAAPATARPAARPATARPTAAPTTRPVASHAPPTAQPSPVSSANAADLEARMRKMLGSINEERHYDMKSYADQIAEAEKKLASDYDVKNLKPPPLKGINAKTVAFEFDIGQVLYAIKVVDLGPLLPKICAGWLVTTRGPEQPPVFYVGTCRKNEDIADPRDRQQRTDYPTPPPLHN